MSEDRAFLGVGWRFPPQFGTDGRARMVSDEADVHEAITVLLGTVPGERVMQPTFGCGLKALVFEEMNEPTRNRIENLVERAILFHEPRVRLDTVRVEWTDPLEGRADILLEFTIRSTNTRSNMVYPFYLLEGTNVRTGR